MRGDLGVVRHVDATRAHTVLGRQPRSIEDALTAGRRSLLDLDLLTPRH